MTALEQRIKEDGRILPGNILKVDSFLNHQIDVTLMDEMASAFQKYFINKTITKVLTIEASGIAMACSVARLLNVPLVFAKKSNSTNLSEDIWCASAHSYTRGCNNTIMVAKRYLQAEDQVLIIDDFLAHGEAAQALVSLVKQAAATVVGVGIAIEKGFQDGGRKLREEGIDVYSLAIIEKMNEEGIVFKHR